MDTTGDGQCDLVGRDTTGDGMIDTVEASDGAHIVAVPVDVEAAARAEAAAAEAEAAAAAAEAAAMAKAAGPRIEEPWIECNSKPSIDPLFNAETDGYDVCIDGARFLPEEVTLSKVTMKIMTADFDFVPNQQAEFDATGGLDDSALSPRYRLRAEYRADPSIEANCNIANPGATILVRLDCIERKSNMMRVVGYCGLNVFTNALDGQQPKHIAGNPANAYALNAGSFQLPLFRTPPSTDDDFNADAFAYSKRVPCATLLLRIVPAAGDRLGTPAGEAEDYQKGQYDSSRCVPSAVEREMYAARKGKEELTVTTRDAAPMAAHADGMDVEEGGKFEDIDKDNDAALVAWIEGRLSGRPAQFLDCADDGHPVRVKPEKKKEIAEVNPDVPSGCCVVS